MTFISLWLGILGYFVFSLFFLALIVWLLNIFSPQGQLFGPVLYQVNTIEKKIALTFDDGPQEVLTPKILDLLKEYGAHATFFVVGERAARLPRLLERMVAEGHEIGNHTYSHTYGLCMPFNTRAKYKEEISAVDRLLDAYKIPYNSWVRFPMGFKNGRMVKAARQLGKRVVAFSFRPYDALGFSPALVERILQKTHPGAIVVLHDGPRQAAGERLGPTVEILSRLLESWQERGYRIVTLGELDGSTSGKN